MLGCSRGRNGRYPWCRRRRTGYRTHCLGRGRCEAGLLARLQVSIAPLIIGSGPQGLTSLSPVDKLKDALRPDTRVFGMGSDIVFDCAFGDQAARAILPLHAPQPLVTAAS